MRSNDTMRISPSYREQTGGLWLWPHSHRLVVCVLGHFQNILNKENHPHVEVTNNRIHRRHFPLTTPPRLSHWMLQPVISCLKGSLQYTTFQKDGIMMRMPRAMVVTVSWWERLSVVATISGKIVLWWHHNVMLHGGDFTITMEEMVVIVLWCGR